MGHNLETFSLSLIFLARFQFTPLFQIYNLLSFQSNFKLIRKLQFNPTIYLILLLIKMDKLEQIAGYLKNKNAEGDVFTVPLSESAKILQQIFASETKCIMLFTSDKNKDGKQWCPYCVNVKPYYNQVYEEINKIKLPFYVFIVGDQPTWKDPNHPFRKNKLLQITSVPTFGYFNGKKLVNKIGGSEMVEEKNRCLVYESATNN